MKWGQHKFGKKSGSAFGAKNKDADEESKKRRKEMADRALNTTIKGGKDRPNISPAEKSARELSSVIDNAATINRHVSNIRNANSKSKNADKYTTMTNEELKTAIDRMTLEQRYESLSKERISKGMSYTSDIIGIVGGVVGIAGSAATIAATMRQVINGG